MQCLQNSFMVQMRKLYYITTIINLFVLINSASLYASVSKDSLLNNLYNNNYRNALYFSEKLIKNNPDEPEGFFYKSMVFWRYILETDSLPAEYKKSFNQSINQTIESASRKHLKNPVDDQYIFFLGAAYGYRGLLNLKIGNVWQAFQDGKKGVRFLKKLTVEKKKSPYFADAYFGIGLYEYYISSVPKFIRVLFFLPRIENKESGVEHLKYAAMHGNYSKIEANYFLIKVLLDKKEVEHTEQYLSEIPKIIRENNLSMVKLEAEINLSKENWTYASLLYNKMFGILERKKIRFSEYSANKVHIYSARAFLYSGEAKQAKIHLEIVSAKKNIRPDYIVPEAHLLLGNVYDVLGERSSALEEYNVVLNLEDTKNSHLLAKKFIKSAFKFDESSIIR